MQDERSDELELTAGQRELEAALRALAPAPAAGDPLALAFAAGQRSARASLRRWRASAAVLFVALGGFLLMHGATPSAGPRGTSPPLLASGDEPAPGGPDQPGAHPSPPSSLAYLSLRHDVLNRGVEAIPSSARSFQDASSEAPRALDSLRRPAGGDSL